MLTAPRVLAAAAVAALALTGCSYSAADAAVVNGTKVPESTVAEAAQVAAPLLQQNPETIRASIAQVEVQGIVARQIAAERGIVLNTSVRAPVIASEPVWTALATDPRSAEFTTRLADIQIVSQQVGVETFAADCAKVDVVVNPRYGRWTPETCGLVADLGGLARTAPTAAPKS